MDDVRTRLSKCTLCADRFSVTATGHRPNPVVWFQPNAKILIAGQAPGMRVHKSNIPFSDPSGDRLRSWLGVSDQTFYDRDRFAILPMAFCFPGYNAKGSDLPPPPICAKTWRNEALSMMPSLRLKILIGGHAMRYHLPNFTTVTKAVQDWCKHPNGVYALPHPSWRNTGWLKKNPWFEAEVIPRLQAAVAEVM